VGVQLGLRANLAQFSLLVGVNALVGGMIGQERTVLPLLAVEEFGLTKLTATFTFIAAFGIVKALTNFVAGALSDRYGRKPVLIAGWLAGVPVPFMLMWAPTWDWVVFANVLLGVNQGLTWSTTVIMKIDLVGPQRRGFAMGLNEAAGYGAVAVTALATGWIAADYGLRPEPFYLGVAFAALGLGLSTFAVRETRGHAHHEAANHITIHATHRSELSTGDIFRLTSFRDRNLSSYSQAGLVNNLNDGLAWGLFPLFFAASGLSVGRIGMLAALYPAAWGLGQLYTGGPLGPHRAQAPHRGWHARPGSGAGLHGRSHRVRPVGSRGCCPGCGHGHGVPHTAGRHRRCGSPHVAGPIGGGLPTVARRRICRGCAHGGRPGRCGIARGGHLRRGRTHRSIRGCGGRAHARDPAALSRSANSAWVRFGSVLPKRCGAPYKFMTPRLSGCRNVARFVPESWQSAR
jgi:MFS family permease